MKRFQFIPVLLALTLPLTGWAIPKPDRCPSVDVIKYRGLLYAHKDCSGINYVVPQFDKYGTSVAWVFAVEGIKARDMTDALNQGIELLKNLSGQPEPIQQNHGTWICDYKVGPDQGAFAITLDENNDVLKPFKLKK